MPEDKDPVEETHTAVTVTVEWESGPRVVKIEEIFHIKDLTLAEATSLLDRLRTAAIQLSWIDEKKPK